MEDGVQLEEEPEEVTNEEDEDNPDQKLGGSLPVR